MSPTGTEHCRGDDRDLWRDSTTMYNRPPINPAPGEYPSPRKKWPEYGLSASNHIDGALVPNKSYWSPKLDLAELFIKLGLGKYTDLFQQQEVTPEPIDPRVAKKIKDMCEAGVRDIEGMKMILKSFVKDICQPVPNPGNHRFYPSDKIISNHIMEKASFSYTSAKQKRLLARYGNMIFLDATYKSTLYNLPLFFIAVRTNVGYQIVGTFICENEMAHSISEGLSMLQLHCENWTPSYIMTDFQESEILAAEMVFTDARVLFCDVHRNRAWQRWTSKKDNICESGPEVLNWLMRLGNANDEEKFNSALKDFQATVFCSIIWAVFGYPRKRWSKAYRTGLAAIVAATNSGIESLHKIFKSKFLHRKTTYSLATMLKIMIDDFFPSMDRTTSLVQQIESEEKNRKWYNDQIEMIFRKIRSLPAADGHSGRQPGFTRKHLELEIARLRETMHESFGTNEQIVHRRDSRVHRIRQVESEMISIQQQRQQMLQGGESQGRLRHQSSSDSANSGSPVDLDTDQVTMATQTDDSPGEPQQDKMGYGHGIPGSIYHGTWPIGKDENIQASIGHHGDLSSVMSFNSTNTSSSQGSGSGAKGQAHTASGGQGQGQPRSLQGQQPQPQPIPLPQQIPPQQLGTKVEMVYGLLSMLGTHDKDDMSRTLLAMSSSQDSCIAMRQSGCLPLLIQLLHGSDKDSALLGNTRGSKAARARASAALHNIVHSHPDDKRGRREARVLRLLEQIRAHCDQLRENSEDEEDEDGKPVAHGLTMDHHPGPAIATLMKLSFDEEHRHAICTLGGLHAIAELLQVDNDINHDTDEQYNITMRRYACMALTNLTFGDGTNKSLLCSLKDSMEALVMQLYSSNEELCQVAASVLRNLSWKADLASKKTLREVGAVTTLMQSSMRVQKETTLKSILSALWNLSAHCSENKADICAVDRALQFLISTLTYKSPSKTTSIIENGGGILRNVSSHIAVREDYRQILRNHGCLQILLKHLRSPSLTIVSNACGTLWNLSARCAEDQQALWEMGAVGMLRNLVHSKHKMISMGSSAALKNLLAARPAMKNIELNKQANGNRPTLHVRKQRALESEIDQNLSETCENVESPRDSPVESKKQETGHFMYPVYPLLDGEQRRQILRGPVIPRSQSGDHTLYENQLKVQHGVARSGSQDSVGSTHSDISHDRTRHTSGGKASTRAHSNMGGSLDRHKESLQLGQRILFEGRTERNPLGAPNSRILQVMQEVALHAGIEGQSHDNDSAVFKTPLPVSSLRSQNHVALQQQQQAHHQQQQHHFQAQQHPSYPTHVLNTQQAAAYQRYLINNLPQNQTGQFGMPNPMFQNQRLQQQHQESRNGDDDDDEKPLDFSMKYQEGSQANQRDPRLGQPPHRPMIGNYVESQQLPPSSVQNQFSKSGKKMFYAGQEGGNKQYNYNSAYAETDLDDPDQPTDYSARYGAEYNAEQYNDERMNYAAQYEEPDPHCADCKLEEARRYNDRLDQAIEDDQIKTFCTEDTPYLSTATSLTDLSTAVKILEEAEQHCPPEETDDETQNFSSKYGENGNAGQGPSSKIDVLSQRSKSDHGQRLEGDNRSGSNITDIQTGTTVIANYHLKFDRRSQESNSRDSDEPQEMSFHDNRNDDAPYDQTKTYCEEGTPVCFSRVSSLSSLHSSEAADRQDPSRRPAGPLESIDEHSDANNSMVKMPPPPMTPNTFRQKQEEHRDGNSDNTEKEHKTVTFDDKEQVQETPMMFSRCTSLGSLSSFDTQSVHSSVFSEYSRRASEVVSPSELPDSPSETMPPSPRRTKSPERNQDRKPVNQELFPANKQVRQESYPTGNQPSLPQQLSSKFITLAQGLYMASAYKMMDLETCSAKSEAPVVYAEEGTPPIFQDNLSEFSCITSDNYNVNEKTLVETPKSKSSSYSNQNDETLKSQSGHISSIPGNGTVTQNRTDPEIDRKDNPQAKADAKPVNFSVKEDGAKVTADVKQDKTEDKGMSSNSDVSEGEDDLLANIISSAMPISSKKMRKSSSDNVIKRKSSSSSKPDSGSSSRSSKTPAKSGQNADSGSKSTSGQSTAKKSLKLGGSSQDESPELKSKSSSTKSQGQGSQGLSPGKQKSHIPRPLQHKQLQQMSQLDSSMDSTVSQGTEESPFNTSHAQSVITRPAQKSRAPSNISNPAILQKARNLSNYELEEEGCKTYATEDTPFSGSMQASPQPSRKFNEPLMPPESNQDTVRSFATEDTPFSGSAPDSPKMTRRKQFPDEFDTETDSIKCYNTEDTPFSGSAYASPKVGSPKLNRKAQIQAPTQASASQQPNTVFRKPEPVSQKQSVPQQQSLPQNMVSSQPQNSNHQSHPALNQELPSVHPQFSPQLYNYLQNDFYNGDDAIKTYATEGTPQNYSRTGSFSDLSSLNTNFEEKVKINEKPSAAVEEKTKTTIQPPADDCQSDNSSSLEENEDLLSELIQSAMPSPKPGKHRRSYDRNPEGAEGNIISSKDRTVQKEKNKQSSESNIPTHFQPIRTSSLTQENRNVPNVPNFPNYTAACLDEMRIFATEDTPSSWSQASTSISLFTTDSHSPTQVKQPVTIGRKSLPSSVTKETSLGNSTNTNYSHTATFGTSNDSVFLHSDGGGDSLRVYRTEDSSNSASCNDSLSSLSIMTDDSKNEMAQQIKELVNHLFTKRDSTSAQQIPNKASENQRNEYEGMPIGSESLGSNFGNDSLHSGKELERHVVGQSTEDQSVAEEQLAKCQSDETKKYGVEGTPLCFSRNSSLSSIHDLEHVKNAEHWNKSKPEQKKENVEAISKHASRDEQAGFKVEHTPICFSRNSSLSSLSVHSDEDDDPDDMALLEDCISSALPPRTRPSREELRHNSHSSRGDHGTRNHSGSGRASKPGYKRNASSGDELERLGEHDSRYSNWRQQPHKSSDEIFRKPTMDAKGRPCRRSRSQDSEKHYKDMSNQHLVHYGTNVHRGSWDSVAMYPGTTLNNMETVEQQRQQLISETQNIVHQVQKMTRSVEKGDDHESEKTDSPASDYNFFMTCSGNTEISVESISKQSFPSSMAPDTDDDILDGSLVGSYRFCADGNETGGQASHDVTLTERNVANAMNGADIGQTGYRGPKVPGMETSITSEDELALAENANIVMSEMMNRMVLSGASTVDEDSFIENETLSLVSNGYMSDTASEASNTWSAGSDFPNERSGNRAGGNGKGRRPRIVKPGSVETPKNVETEVKGVRGKRKPLYSSKSLQSPTPPGSSMPKTNKGKTQSGSSIGKVSPRTIPGSSSPSSENQSISGKKSLRTMPQASSTPVKASQAPQKSRQSKPGTPQRSSSLDQRSQQNSRQTLGNRSASTNRSDSVNRSDSANRSGSSNRSGSANRSTNSANRSQSTNSPSKIPSKSNTRAKSDTNDVVDKPKSLSKQGTFIKESTNRNAPVISPDEKNKENIAGVRLRQKKASESSSVNRNSSGSSKSNYSNTSNNSNSFSTTSSDSPPDSWSKALSSYSFASEQTPNRKKDSKLKNTASSDLKKSLKSSNSKIPSPCKPGLNKSGSGQSLKSSSSRDRVSKSNSGVSLTSVSSGLIKTGSNNSLKQNNSRPSTPVNMSRKGSSSSETTKNDKKQNGKKGVTSKISGLWKSEDKGKGKDKKANVSKLPVAKAKGKAKDNKTKDEDSVKRGASPKPNANRNTYILDESTVEGLNRSSTYDKLDATNDKSQIPSHDSTQVSALYMNKSVSVSSNEGKPTKQVRSIFDDNELNKTCRDFSAFEIGVEYNLDDAWASNVEKSIEVMSKSIEDGTSRINSFYDDTVDTSKMDLTGSPAKRLSKSGSMSEIETELGKVHSGTWTKKKSYNDYATLPHAEDTSRTLPLVKRSESLNFSANMSVSHYDYDESQEVWIRRDDKLRASDISGMSTKKKKGFRGSSGFLNAVSKMFGSKKTSDKQSKSMIVNESKKGENVKQSKKEKDSKLNKSEVKLSKAEQKQLKAELKAQSKLNKSELKMSKKEAKLNKSMKSEKKIESDDTSSQVLGSSTSSLKRSAEYLIDIDKSDDEDININAQSFTIPKTGSLTDKSKTSPKSPDLSKSLRKDESITHNNQSVPLSNSVKQTSSSSLDNSDNDIYESVADKSQFNRSVKSSPTQHLTKTEMLLARRQAQLNSSSERSESEDETTGKKKSIITTV